MVNFLRRRAIQLNQEVTMNNVIIKQPYSRPKKFDQLMGFLQDLYRSLRHDRNGVVANHLPELAQANPDWFGLCAITHDGTTMEAGDSDITFTVQSIAKPLILALALEDHDANTILDKIGVEPTGERFDSILNSGPQDKQNLNPFMNAGAIATLDLIGAHNLEQRFTRFCELLQRLLMKPVEMDHNALASRRQSDHHNRAIAYLLLSRGLIKGPVEDLLELYHRICCLSLDCRDLATIAAVLANNGLHPRHNQQVLPSEHVKTILSVMQTCGLYDFSGQWAYRVGLPAKSSLSGAMLVVVPGQFGFAVYSPPLDETHQKSVRGLQACELLSKKFGLHMFRPRMSESPIEQTKHKRIPKLDSQDKHIDQLLQRIHTRTKNTTEGHCYNIAPDVFPVDPNAHAICITTVDGRRYIVGNHDAPFLIQSISKVFAYGLALEDHGREVVLQNVDVEPSGNPYDAIIRLEQRSKRPHNPMVNTGGIATSALINGDDPAHQLDRILRMYQRYIGHEVYIEMRTYLAEIKSGDRNKAIAYLLRHFGMLENEVDNALALYLQQCSAVINCEDLSVMAATLANGGVNPLTEQRAIQEDHVGDLLTVMYTCGMYDFAGEWSYRIGLPAKSGVSGGILAVVPGLMGIAVYSPRLDQHGNSIAGIRALEAISTELDLHIFSSA
jgi:glutaminase